MKKYVKFKGRFPDLKKKDGWTFWKAFARNYRVYTWRTPGSQYGQSMNVWQHYGGYLDVADLFDELSAVLVEAIQDGSLDREIVSGRDNKQYWIAFDLVNKKIVDRFTNEKCREDRHANYYQLGVPDKDFDDKKRVEFINRWRDFNLQGFVVDKLKELLANGWIEVQEDKRKP